MLVCMGVVSVCIFVHSLCGWWPLNWSYRWLWPNMWTLELNLGPLLEPPVLLIAESCSSPWMLRLCLLKETITQVGVVFWCPFLDRGAGDWTQSESRCLGRTRRGIPLELKLQEVVNCLMWMLGKKFGSFARAVNCSFILFCLFLF